MYPKCSIYFLLLYNSLLWSKQLKGERFNVLIGTHRIQSIMNRMCGIRTLKPTNLTVRKRRDNKYKQVLRLLAPPVIYLLE